MRIATVLCLALVSAWAVACAEPPVKPVPAGEAAPVPLPSDPEVVRGELANGVTYLLRPAPNTRQAVQLMLAVRAGQLTEREDERGYAHFVEHVAFDAAQRFEQIAPLELLRSAGMQPGADTNARTEPTSTVYRLLLPEADRQRLEQGLDILRGWAGSVRFDAASVERQREIVLTELRARAAFRTRPEGVIAERVARGSVFEHGPEGDALVLRAASAERLEAFYRRWYTPRRMAVVATGAFDVAEMQRLIAERWGHLPEGSAPSAPERVRLPALPGDEGALLTAPDTAGADPVVHVDMRLPFEGVRGVADYRSLLTDRIIASLLDARIAAASRAAGPPVAITACNTHPERVAALVRSSCSASIRDGQLARGVELLLVELERAARHGFEPAEVEGIKPTVAGAIRRELDELRGQPVTEGAERLVAHFVTGAPIMSPDAEQALAEELLAGIEPEGVLARARQWLGASRLVLVMRGRDDKSVTSEARLMELIADVKRRPLARRDAPEPFGELMSVLPEPGEIAHTERNELLDLWVWRLSNGARVVYKPVRDGTGSVLVRGVSPGGTSKSEPSNYWSAALAARVVEEGGVGQHDNDALSRLLAGTSVTARTRLGERFEAVDAGAAGADLERMFQLVHLYLSAPRRDVHAFEAFRARLASPRSSKHGFERALEDALHGAPRELDARAAAELDLDAALAFYGERFGDVGDFTFVIAGDIAQPELEPLVQRYLASLRGTPRDDSPGPSRRASNRSVERVRFFERPGMESEVVLQFHAAAQPSPEASVDLEALGQLLQQRSMDALREKLGAVYAVRVEQGWVSGGAFVQLRFTCAPGDVERLKHAALDTIDELKTRRVSDAEVEHLRARRREVLEAERISARFWVAELAQAYASGRDPRSLLERARLTSRIDPEHLQRAARRYLRADQRLEAVWAAGTGAPSVSR